MAHPDHATTDSAASHPVTVRELLAEPLFHDRLIGGAAGVHRTVTWCLPLSEVDVAVASSASPRIPRRELSGVAVHVPASALADQERSRELVANLAVREVPALFVWSPTGDPAGLPAAIRSADSHSIPLVKLPPDGDYQCVGRLVATKVLAHSAHVLEYSTRVHETLGKVFARGSGLQALAESLSTLSQTPVLIADAGGEVLSSVVRHQEFDTEQLADAASELHKRSTMFSAEQDFDGGQAHGHDELVEIGSVSVYTVTAMVSVSGEPYGFVSLLETSSAPDAHSLAQHRIAAEQGSALIAAEMLRQRSVREAEERAHDDFVDALVHGRFTSQHELAARSRHHNFAMDARHAVLVLSAPGVEADRRINAQRLVLAEERGYVAGQRPWTLGAQIGSMIVVIRQLAARRDRTTGPLDEQNAVRRYAHELHQSVAHQLGVTPRIAYGRPADGAAGVVESYREARTALGLATKLDQNDVCGYDELRVFAVIQEFASSEHGREFASEMLEPLREDEHAPRLDEIVLAYIAESGNVKAAARRLHLHRNTMLSKIDRATRTLGADIRQADTQFLVWLAYHIETLNTVTRTLDAEFSSPV